MKKLKLYDYPGSQLRCLRGYVLGVVGTVKIQKS